tara:strand:- start:238 stop:2016 length:1779 start_codon:yes stop_codon:yes gene_type:complete
VYNNNEEEKKLLEPPRPCPNEECTSSDGFHIWQKGKVIDGYCFVCLRASDDPYGDLIRSGKDSPISTGPVISSSPAPSSTPVKSGLKISVEDGMSHPIRGIPERCLSYATCEHFGVRIGVSSKDGETPIYTLFPRHRNGDHIGWKNKIPDNIPPYVNSGGGEVDFFGSHKLKPQGKKIYVTEGEYDAMSVFQSLQEGSTLQGYFHPVVSLSDGSGSALKSFILQSELLDGYDEIILVFDNDEAGKKARDSICKAYAGKVSYVTIPHPHKDANDMLVAGKGTELKWLCLTGAKKYHPDGIVKVKDLKHLLRDDANQLCYPYPESMPELNKKTYGARPATIVTVTSGSGCGKTQFMRELMYHYLVTTDEKIAGVFLEEGKMETVRGLIALKLNKRYHLPDVHVSAEEEDAAFDELYDSDRVTLYDFFGGMDDGSLLSKLRYYAITGHKFIFLDHLSIIVSEFASEGDERKRIDTLMTKLAKFVKEYDVVLFLVVHLRKPDNSKTPFELGAVPTLDDLRGSASLKQLSWDVIGLARNQQHDVKYCANTTESTVLKCRFTGRTGTADHLNFNEHTGRMNNVECPAGYRPTPRRGIS